MTQITDQISGAANYVAYSTDGNSWTDISGVANQVTPDPQTRMNGSTYTFEGDGALVTFGKKEPFSVRVRLVYSEANAAYDALADAHEATGGSTVYIRWAPKGNTGGNIQYTTPATKISEWNYPAPDGTSADPLMCEFVVGPVPSLTRAAIAT